MAAAKKDKKEIESSLEETGDTKNKPTPNDIGWTDYVLGLLSDDEKIAGNPTTDGLRRIFEIALDCAIIQSTSNVVQSPDPGNEKRATVVHNMTFVLNKPSGHDNILNTRSVSGAADVYWGNCDKIYRNHPVAVAETRAEGRALRRGLKLRKVVAAEELSKEIEDDVNGNNVNKITNNQINFIDVIAKRIDINVLSVIKNLNFKLDNNNIYSLSYDSGVALITKLSELQRDIEGIDSDIKGYDSNWK